MVTKKSAKELSEIAMKAVRVRRANKAVGVRRGQHPGGSDEKLNTDDVLEAMSGRDVFSTGDVMKEFGAAVDNATAVAAVLRRRGLIEKDGLADDGTALWRWIRGA